MGQLFLDAVFGTIKAAVSDLERRFETRLKNVEQTAALPGRDGRDGASIQGPQGIPGPVGPQGERGPEGPSGASIQGPAGDKGLDGKDGKDGLDGFGFDDMDEHYEDDGRILVRTYRMGDRVKEFRHVTAQTVWRGKYEPGKVYQKGDVVAWSGSSWVATEDTKSEPGAAAAASRAWGQMVRKGDVGKTGQKGLAGDRGPQGPEGPRGPQGY